MRLDHLLSREEVTDSEEDVTKLQVGILEYVHIVQFSEAMNLSRKKEKDPYLDNCIKRNEQTSFLKKKRKT